MMTAQQAMGVSVFFITLGFLLGCWATAMLLYIAPKRKSKSKKCSCENCVTIGKV